EQLEALLREKTADTGLMKAVEKMRQGVDAGRDKLMERLEQYLLRKGEETSRQGERVIEALWPEGSGQERLIGALSPLLRTTGPAAPAKLAKALREDVWELQVVRL